MEIKFEAPEETEIMHVKKEAGFRNSYAALMFKGKIQGVENPFTSRECRDMGYMVPQLREALGDALKAHVKTLFGGQVTAQYFAAVSMIDRSEINIHVRFKHRIPSKGTSTKDLIAKDALKEEVIKCKDLIENTFHATMKNQKRTA